MTGEDKAVREREESGTIFANRIGGKKSIVSNTLLSNNLMLGKYIFLSNETASLFIDTGYLHSNE